MEKMLKDMLNWPEIMDAPRYAGGHSEIMDVLFTNSFVLASYIEEDYQGELAYIYLVYSGTDWAKIAIITDYFGSCSGCDAWEGADDRTVREMCIALANNARLFDDIDDVIEFLSKCAKEDDACDFSFWRTAGPLLEDLEKNRDKFASL
jgi:hypothetical protein